MFYNQTAIDSLVSLVGWANSISPTNLVISSDNTSSLIGVYFDSYNRLAIVENIYSMVCNAEISMDDFNAYLTKLKKDVVYGVLLLVFDNEERANFRYCSSFGRRMDISTIDYSDRIINKPKLFSNIIGLKMAITCVELFISSSRLNDLERSGKLSLNSLRMELAGIVDNSGNLITKGLYAKFKTELEAVKNILFPIQQPNYVVGRHVW